MLILGLKGLRETTAAWSHGKDNSSPTPRPRNSKKELCFRTKEGLNEYLVFATFQSSLKA